MVLADPVDLNSLNLKASSKYPNWANTVEVPKKIIKNPISKCFVEII